jgi:hypothetical protein
MTHEPDYEVFAIAWEKARNRLTADMSNRSSLALWRA